MSLTQVWKEFQIKKFDEDHDFYLKSDTLLLVDVLENFRKMCLNIHHLGPVIFPSGPELA